MTDITRNSILELQDKNGKNIREGDVLLISDEYTEIIDSELGGPTEPDNQTCSVIFQKDRAAYGVNILHTSNWFSKGFLSFDMMLADMGEDFIKEEVEILGNIYANPELIEEYELNGVE